MYKLIVFIFSAFLFSIHPLFAQKNAKKDDSQAYSDSRTSSSNSIFEVKEGKSTKKSSQFKRNKRTKSLKKTAYKRNKIKSSRKKGSSDCDCPGSKKAQRKKRRA